MPKRLTLKQRRFQRQIANPANKTLKQCGDKAGYTSSHIYTPIVKSKISKVYSKEWLLDEFKDIRKLAKKDKDYGNTCRAVENIGKLTGQYIEKIENTTPQNVNVIFAGTKDKTVRDNLLKQSHKDKKHIEL